MEIKKKVASCPNPIRARSWPRWLGGIPRSVTNLGKRDRIVPVVKKVAKFAIQLILRKRLEVLVRVGVEGSGFVLFGSWILRKMRAAKMSPTRPAHKKKQSYDEFRKDDRLEQTLLGHRGTKNS